MFDGSVSSAGPISHYLDIGIQPHAKYPPIESRLNVTKLHGADIVLGSNWMILLKMAGSGYRRFARSRLYEYILVVMRFYYCI